MHVIARIMRRGEVVLKEPVFILFQLSALFFGDPSVEWPKLSKAARWDGPGLLRLRLFK